MSSRVRSALGDLTPNVTPRAGCGKQAAPAPQGGRPKPKDRKFPSRGNRLGAKYTQQAPLPKAVACGSGQRESRGRLWPLRGPRTAGARASVRRAAGSQGRGAGPGGGARDREAAAVPPNPALRAGSQSGVRARKMLQTHNKASLSPFPKMNPTLTTHTERLHLGFKWRTSDSFLTPMTQPFPTQRFPLHQCVRALLCWPPAATRGRRSSLLGLHRGGAGVCGGGPTPHRTRPPPCRRAWAGAPASSHSLGRAALRAPDGLAAGQPSLRMTARVPSVAPCSPPPPAADVPAAPDTVPS